MARARLAAIAPFIVSFAITQRAAAAENDEPAAPSAPDDATASPAAAEARAAFLEGTRLASEARWSEALASFEKAASIRPHAVTSYNIAACERALGRYTRARQRLLLAFEQHEQPGSGPLPAVLSNQARIFLSEIEGLLVRVRLTVMPVQASIAVDGRPLAAMTSPFERDEGIPSVVAGIREPSPAEATPARTFDLWLDPGAHVVTLTRKGFSPVHLNRTLAPGERTTLDLTLDRLPATLRIAASEADALVSLDGEDVGPVPVTLLRPPGSHRIVVRKSGFDPYESEVSVEPGEELSLMANMNPASPAILEQWWFWSAAAAVVATSAVVTWAVTRPEADPPPYDGGSSGWIVFPQARFSLP